MLDTYDHHFQNIMPATKHKMNDQFSGNVTQDWLSSELAKAETSLCNVIEAHEDDNSEIDNYDALEVSTLSPKDEEPKIRSLSNEMHVISLAKAYLDAVQNVDTTNNEQKVLVYLESHLKNVLQSHHDILSTSSTEFCVIYKEISRRHISIQRRIQSAAVLDVRKTLRQNAYPSPHAAKFILTELEAPSNESEFKMHVESLRKIDCKILTKEFVNPILQRVQHHFLTSRTIPQDKLLKIPHLIIAYLRKVIPYTALIVSRIECEVCFYHQVNDLIQHVLFQRGYFEKISTASPAALTVLVQDVMKYDVFVQQHIREECSSEISSLTEHIICRNMRLFQWWIQAQRNHALHILGESKKYGCDAMKSTAEVLQSLLYSQRAKISLLRQNLYKSMCFEQIVIPTCMKYLDLQHQRATVIRSAMDTSTIYNLSSYVMKWLILIEQTSQTAEKLYAFDSPELSSLSRSFDKFSIAMIEDCANSYVNLLVERSTLSSFLMTAGHLLSHGGDSVLNNGMEDVYMILNVWNCESISTLSGGGARNEIISKVCHYLEQQLLEVVMDDSLEMTNGGCRSFSSIVLEMLKVLNGNEDAGCCGRLHDISLFMLETSKIRQVVCTLVDKEQDDKLDYLELEQDEKLFATVESMIHSKGFTCMTIEDAISLLNRCDSP